MLGAILGFGFAIFFGLNSIIVRRGTLRASANYVATLTVFTGPPFFFLLTLITGDLWKIGSFSWQAILFFSLSGIIHFALGRTFGYRATQILGANRAGIMTGLNGVVSVVLAVIVVKETLTPLMVAGILLSLSGPTIVAIMEEKRTRSALVRADPHGINLDKKTFYKGMFFGIGSAFFWGSSAIFVKLALDNGGSSLGGSFIAFSAASLVVLPSLLNRKNREEIFSADKGSFKLAMMSGMTTNIAQMLRYIALFYGTVIVVSMASRTIPIWVISLSFIFNRHLESFSRWVLLGNALLIIGTILVLI